MREERKSLAGEQEVRETLAEVPVELMSLAGAQGVLAIPAEAQEERKSLA